MSVTIQEIVDLCKAEAIAAKFFPTEESDWRYFCRQYSQKFHTRLDEVLLMDPEFVISQVFESLMDDVDVREQAEELLEKIYIIEDPEYEAEQEADLQDFIKDAEAEEEKRIKEGRPVHKALDDEPTLQPKVQTKSLPKQGYVNLSYLEKQDQEE